MSYAPTYTDTTTPFGSALRALRQARHLSQSRLALRAGMCHSLISRYESGQRNPSREAVLHLASVIGVDGLAPVETDALLLDAGFLPVDPDSILADEPELLAVLRVLRDDATPEPRKVGIRAMLGALAELGQGERAQESPPCLPTAPPRDEIPAKGSDHAPVRAREPQRPADALSAALVAPHGKAA